MSDLLPKNTVQREIDFHNQRYLSESSNRSPTRKYYRLKKEFDQRFLELVAGHSKGKKVLEIGCGPNINLPHFAELAKECHGIDISDVAIEQARHRLGDKARHVTLSVMNAESMDFNDDYFDVICGKGIIHHLNTANAYKEISRVLKPDGIAVFIEPMGHNPFINLYRSLTPVMRSDDEHPLLMKDIHMAEDWFGNIDVEYQHISSILSAFIPGDKLYKSVFTILDAIDRTVMKVLPYSRKYCWMAFLKLRLPNKFKE